MSTNCAFAQIVEKQVKGYTIQSLDGTSEKIYVTDDYMHDSIKIRCLKDSLQIEQDYQVDSASILNKNFLRIIYRPKCGSDCRLRGIIFLCVKGGKLYVSMRATLLFEEEITRVYDRRTDSLKLFDEKSVYKLKLRLTGENKSDYKLLANIHDMNSSKHDPLTSYNHDDKTTLNFDVQENIFYNDFKDINASFDIWDPKAGEVKRRITGNFPVIKLGRKEYYYINDIWYEGSGVGNNSITTDYTWTNPAR